MAGRVGCQSQQIVVVAAVVQIDQILRQIHLAFVAVVAVGAKEKNG
jgi:hypothetical protein